MLADSGVELVGGRARLLGPWAGDLAGRTLRSSPMLVATGGSPAQEALPSLRATMTSNEVLDLREVPQSLLVIGGGYTAVEFASILAGLGVKATLAFRDTHPLRGFDHDLRERLAHTLTGRGIALAGGVGLQALVRGGTGFELQRADDSALGADAVLNATGLRPNSAGLGLEDAGV